MLRLRLRSPSGTLSVQVPVGGDMEDLENSVSNALQLAQGSFTLLLSSRVPPVAVDLDSEATIGDICKDNDLMTVQKAELSGVQLSGTGPMRRKRVKAMVASPGGLAFRADNISTLSSVSKKKTVKPVAQLSPSDRIATLSTLGHHRKRPSKRLNKSAGIDLSEQLVSAASGEKGALNKILRNDFTRAVQFRYEEANALARLTAVSSRSYTITPVELLNKSSKAQPFKAEVKYSRGINHRSEVTEIVDILPEAIVLEVLREALSDESGHGREILKPKNMARQSPRIFWSLVHAHGADLQATLATMFPNISDWRWLYERPRELSAKAAENKRQLDEKLAAKSARSKRSKHSDSLDAPVDRSEVKKSPADEQINERIILEEAKQVVAALKSHKFEDIVPAEHGAALERVLGDKSLLSLASAAVSNNFRGKLMAASSVPLSAPPMSEVQAWVEAAQLRASAVFWAECVCQHSEQMRRALAKAGISSPSAFVAAADAKGGFPALAAMLEDFPRELNRGGRKGLDLLQWLYCVCTAMIEANPWVSEVDEIYEEEFYEGEEIEDSELFFDELRKEGWQFGNESANSFLAERVQVWVDDEHMYALPGVVVAYLPATEDEPMALWKVELEKFEGSNKKAWYEDLEYEEVVDAINRVNAL